MMAVTFSSGDEGLSISYGSKVTAINAQFSHFTLRYTC